MSKDFRDDESFKPWGPFISPNYQNEIISTADIIIASTVFALTLINALIALWLAFKQTTASRSPLRSVYVWMIWLELTVSVVMGIECFLHLLKIIPPSFAFYFTILSWWCIQVQLLLQIIINRIRVIVPDRRRSRDIMIATAVFVTMINISVFFIWIPARLQISKKYHMINEYWDRTEKCLYLIVDAMLNWYFLKTVKANLISNGLTKYNKLVKFNQRIVIVSLLMDVMIIGAMSIHNSFVYIQFHPLAYLVKLNIEMTMANLIKRIAISASRRKGQNSIALEFKSSSNPSTSGRKSAHLSHWFSNHELGSIVSYTAKGESSDGTQGFQPTGTQIKTTKEIKITSEPNPHQRGSSEVDITGGNGTGKINVPGVVVGETVETPRTGSLNSSVRSTDVVKRGDALDSDEEAALVGRGKGWGRNTDRS